MCMQMLAPPQMIWKTNKQEFIDLNEGIIQLVCVHEISTVRFVIVVAV